MRIIIYTGKGGVGKTSIAAATSLKLAQNGIKTLVISTDLAHSLADSLDIEISQEKTEVNKNLTAMELNPQTRLEKNWDKIYNYIVDLMKVVGVKDIFAEELTMFPGVEELFSLLEIHDCYQENKYEALILDFPPTASTLRLLSFFDIIGWYMERFFKIKRRSVKVLRTFTDSLMEMPLPDDDVFVAFEEIYNKMALVRDILADAEITSVRLVMNPEEMVINESQRAFTYLNLYDFNVDAVVVNKLIPSGIKTDFYQKIIENQQNNLQRIKDMFSGLEVFTLPLLNDELRGIDNLKLIGEELYSEKHPLDVYHQLTSMKMNREGDLYHYQIYLPFLQKGKFKLHQKGGLLIITVGNYKQKIQLPQLVSNKKIKKAQYSNKQLHLYFKE